MRKILMKRGEVKAKQAVVCSVCKSHNSFEKGVCQECGFNYLSLSLVQALMLKQCANISCHNKIAITAEKCPKFKTKNRINILGKLIGIYLLLTGPLKSYLMRPGTSGISILDQVILYAGVFLGVVFGHRVRSEDDSTSSSITLIAALIVSIIIIPSVLKEPILSPETPFIARFGFSVQRGAFADLVIEGIETALVKG